MMIFKITVTATEPSYGTDKSEHFVAAYDAGQAIDYISKMLEKAGWRINDVSCCGVVLHDIRDACDHTTDTD